MKGAQLNVPLQKGFEVRRETVLLLLKWRVEWTGNGKPSNSFVRRGVS